ncbi:TadE/TadG family type IV pilus assembly protein [Rhizobium sp. FKL33]|uniref:TadE/TadG family type IV pilus assembly protein n=1 Tax=Rhizobium sp. FKL33 TaxID=2562307 RepID=UPI0010BF89B3|nr:TadE/TadG family type IV pilus assembly protein [Rhizobium sp. FKL33]
MLRRFRSAAARTASLFGADRSGNFALTFALVSVPTLIGVGASIDYVHAYNIRDRMQDDLDAALIAAVREVDTLTEANIKERVKVWFNAQGKSAGIGYTIDTDTIAISKSNRTIQATVQGVVPTTMMKIAGIDNVNVKVAAAVAGPATSYLEVYIALDKSASMLLAATSAGQTTMMNIKNTSGSASNCVFACHEVEGGPWKVGSSSYSTLYSAAKAASVSLRADVAVTAAQEVVDLIKAADPTGSRIKVGLYTLGETATQELAPTYSASDAITALKTDKDLTSATSIAYSYFDKSLAALSKYVGSAGDGSSKDSPLKLVLILTDGVQSQRSWVTTNNGTATQNGTWICVKSKNDKCVKYNTAYFPDQPKVSPLNPNWCKSMKTNSATVGVLYTEYLAIDTDWGYNGTVGETMATSGFKSIWGGTIKTGVATSTTRRDYIPYALSDCASSSDLFLAANDPDEIEAGLATIFQQYLGSVRLTR